MGNERSNVSVLIGLALLGLTSGTARADLPADRISEYSIRETPADPESDVIFVVTLELTAVDQDGDEIAWEIGKMTLTKPAPGGDTIWVEDAPAPDTPDGYWWIEHADPADPQDIEFDWPPSLLGTVTAADPADDDLEYDFGGGHCDSECQELFGGQVGAATYIIILLPELLPEAEGDDEAVQITGETIYG